MSDIDKSELETLYNQEARFFLDMDDAVLTDRPLVAMQRAKAIQDLITQQCNQARIEELQRCEQHVFKLRSNVPRLRTTPPQMDEYYRERKAELEASNDQ